jgi:N-acetyl-anhydromuramyl-L-alanine amidase AmpD
MKITHITVHCSATKASVYVDAAIIDRWHKEQGYQKIGYHFVIKRDGSVEGGRSPTEVGAHVAGHNTGNLGICLVGGLDASGRPETNYTEQQFHSLTGLLWALKEQFPTATILGHRDWPGVKKDCPCFDVRTWINQTGVFATNQSKGKGNV